MSDDNARPQRELTPADPHRAGVRALAPGTDRIAVRADAGDAANPVLFGHFARFNEWTEIDSWIEGHFMERIAPTAFDKTFKERAGQIRVLFQHGRDPMVGDKPIAEPLVMKRDGDIGAYYEARLFDGVPELIVDGLRADQYGASFKMTVMREEIVESPDPSDANPHGLREHTIKEIRLHEFGPVTFPAYAGATAGVRSLTDEFVFEWLAREPSRARELIGATDLSRAALQAAADEQDPAPSTTDAAPSGTSAAERRDPRTSGRYGLSQDDPRPSWAL